MPYEYGMNIDGTYVLHGILEPGEATLNVYPDEEEDDAVFYGLFCSERHIPYLVTYDHEAVLSGVESGEVKLDRENMPDPISVEEIDNSRVFAKALGQAGIKAELIVTPISSSEIYMMPGGKTYIPEGLRHSN